MRRQIIFDVIGDFPGIGFNEIARRTNLSNGVVSHHILQLLQDNKIIKTGVRAKYFHRKIPEKDIKFLVFLKNSTNYEMIKLLLKMDLPLTAEGITKAIKKSRSTVSVNLKKLEKMQIIGRKILNKNNKLTSDVGYYIINEEFMRKIFSKYDLKSKNEQ